MKKIVLIGGSPCSGKSTISNMLKEKYECQVINVDDYMGPHIGECNKSDHPYMYQWKEYPWHELFSRDVSVQLKEEIYFYMEEWTMSKRDILKDTASDFVIIEGCALMPVLVHELMPTQVLYMLPTESFQRDKYKERSWAYDILEGSKNPEEAFDKWMCRDIEFANHIGREAKKHHYNLFVNDGSQSIEEMFIEVEKLLFSEETV